MNPTPPSPPGKGEPLVPAGPLGPVDLSESAAGEEDPGAALDTDVEELAQPPVPPLPPAKKTPPR